MPASPPPLPPGDTVVITDKPTLVDLLADLADDDNDTSMTVDRCPDCGVDPDQPHRWGCSSHGSQQILIRR